MNASTQAEHSSAPAWVVIDVETTGLSPVEHRIAEIAVIVLDLQGTTLGEACTLIDPGGNLGPVEGHGIEPEFLIGAPRFADLAGWLQQWLMGKVVVGHNLLFTSAFLDEEFRRAGIDMPHVPVICTMTHAPRYLPSISGRTLEQCCAAAEIEIGEPRSALTRARAAADLFRRFLSHRTTLPSPWVDNLGKARRMQWPPTASRDFPMLNRPVPKPEPEPEPEPVVARASVKVPAATGSAKVPVREPEVEAEAEEQSTVKISGKATVPDAADLAAEETPEETPEKAVDEAGADEAGAEEAADEGAADEGAADEGAADEGAADEKAAAKEATAEETAAETAEEQAAELAEDLAEAEEFVAEVIDNAPRQPDETGPVTAYLGALDAAVSDRVLSFTEAIHLKDLAAALAIFEAEQAGAHRTYLRTLAATAWTDHQITDGERTDLLTVGKLLDVPEAEVEKVIAEAKPKPKPVKGSAAVTPQAKAAAWYPDPYGAARLRWWDGAAWTGHTHS